ncbi:hypothetical protein NBH00_18570 [Paraconexibacter antarcticus]|uniref:DUF1059 domain-containing protein n=1 Tax=Paraconexibacter antarcticus TaxID=2949664 RepID=A0ABY5DQZ2_9ACTN|nr:hypothetical protein [Paraconexibacter antarcticus]UTI63346.1 hypothetical protein NBH00_18570 [Paraconexibacter antarcticus]
MLNTICKGCGVTLSGKDEDALVTVVQQHVAETHAAGHRPSREQVLAVIRQRGDSAS